VRVAGEISERPHSRSPCETRHWGSRYKSTSVVRFEDKSSISRCRCGRRASRRSIESWRKEPCFLGMKWSKKSNPGAWRSLRFVVFSMGANEDFYQPRWLATARRQSKQEKVSSPASSPSRYGAVPRAMLATSSGISYCWCHWPHSRRVEI